MISKSYTFQASLPTLWPNGQQARMTASFSLIQLLDSSYKTQPRTLKGGFLFGDSAGLPMSPLPYDTTPEHFHCSTGNLQQSPCEIRMTLEKTCILIAACAILHNIAILGSEPTDAGFENIEDQPELTEYCGPEDEKM